MIRTGHSCDTVRNIFGCLAAHCGGSRAELKQAACLLLQVLAALSVKGGCGANSHVPYRDSRLTQLLWEGLRCGA